MFTRSYPVSVDYCTSNCLRSERKFLHIMTVTICLSNSDALADDDNTSPAVNVLCNYYNNRYILFLINNAISNCRTRTRKTQVRV